MSDIIFDFDGTIADSFVLAMSIFHDMNHREAPLTAEEIERLRGMTLLEVAADLQVRPWLIPWLVARGRKKMKSRMDEVQGFDGMDEVIKQLRADGHHLYITSSNSSQNIQLFLDRHSLRGEFIRVYGSVGLLGKARILRKVVRRNKLRLADTFYIGDEVRDVVAAQKAELRMIAVSWGYNTAAILNEHHPDFLVNQPSEISTIIANFNQ